MKFETDALQGLFQNLKFLKGISKAKNKEKLNHKARQRQETFFLKVRMYVLRFAYTWYDCYVIKGHHFPRWSMSGDFAHCRLTDV